MGSQSVHFQTAPLLDSFPFFAYIFLSFASIFDISDPLRKTLGVWGCRSPYCGRRGKTMKIDISNLSEGSHEYELTAEPGEIGLGDQFHNEIRVTLTLDKNSRQIHMTADVETIGRFRCDRCVEEFDRELRNNFQMLYMSEEADRDLNDPDEVRLVSPDLREVDIGDDVRQFIMLAVPQKILCKESCAGLCPRCGRNLNRERCTCTVEEIDPRWDKLRGLLNVQ